MDPYGEWLGVPAGPRPPTHYQLLGIEPAASGAAVERAAVERTTVVRRYQSGRYAEEATKLLNGISAARFALVDPARRAAYDGQLAAGPSIDRAEPDLEFAAPPAEPGVREVVVAVPVARPPLPASFDDPDDLEARRRSFVLPAAAAGVLGLGALVAWPHITKERAGPAVELADARQRVKPDSLRKAAEQARTANFDADLPLGLDPTPAAAPEETLPGARRPAAVPFEPGEEVAVPFPGGPRNARVLRAKSGRCFVAYDGLDDSHNEWVEAARISARGTRPGAMPSAAAAAEARSIGKYLEQVSRGSPSGRKLALARLAALPVDPARRAAVADAINPLLDDPALRLSAAAALARWGNDDTARAFADWLRERPAPPAMAVLAAGQLGADGLRAPLVELLKARIQTDTVVAALGRMGPKAEPDVLPLLDHWDVQVRAAACEALAEIAGPNARAALEKAAAAPDLAPVANAALQRLAERRPN